MLRIWTLIVTTILGAAWLPAQNPYVAQQGSNLSQGFGPAVVPAVLNQTSAMDPYALVGVRRTLPWLGGIIGTGQNTTPSLGAQPILTGPIQGNGGLFGGNLLGGQFANGNSALFGGGAGLRNSGQSMFARMPLLGQGRLFPDVQNRINERWWFNADYLLWNTRGMDVPALVTSSPVGTDRDTAAVLGETGTTVLFGNRSINGDTEGGYRLGGGFWLSQQKNFAIEAEYLRLEDQDDGFAASSDGSMILGRPFFDIVAGQETAQLASFPGLVSGSVNVDTETSFQSFLINGRASLCPTNGHCCNSCSTPNRVDWIVGYRYLRLDDRITVSENLTSLIPTAPGTIALTDNFRTENEFNGLQLGLVHRTNFRRSWLESMLRVAVGSNRQTVQINGSNQITEAGITDTLNGGLLALSSNSGQFSDDEFSMIPELGLKFGFRVTERLTARIGYNVIYFPNVVRAGDQIETDVNPNLIPPEADPVTGPLRPRINFVESDYWAQGLTLGGEIAF